MQAPMVARLPRLRCSMHGGTRNRCATALCSVAWHRFVEPYVQSANPDTSRPAFLPLPLGHAPAGSGRSFTAYVFNKAHLPAGLPTPLAAEQAAAQSVETPALAADAAAPSPTVQQGGVALAAAEPEESVQSSATPGRARRQRRPSAKQAAAEEQVAEEARARAQQPQRSARAQRADRRNAATRETAEATASQQAAAAAAPGEQAAAAVPDSPSRHTRSRAAHSGTAAAAGTAAASSPGKSTRAAAAAAAKLSSPQKGGVQKRSSPAKPAKAAAVAAAAAGGAAGAPVCTSPRKLALSLALDEAASGKGSKAAPAAVQAGGVNPLAARVVKNGAVAQAAAKVRTSPRKQAAVAAAAPRRRGLVQQQ